jgi:ATP-binding cassette subfamily F protein 3
LDLPSLVWVERYLLGFRGTLLFVSHDRALLNRLATITLHLSQGQLTPYVGNFDRFLAAREERLELEEKQAEAMRKRRESMERFVERFGAKASKASQAQSRVKMIARIKALEESLGGEGEDASIFIQLPPAPKTPRVVLTIEDGAIGYDRTLANGIKLLVERGAKVAVIGANGIGKSTLLRTLSGRLAPRDGKFALGLGVQVAYFSQDQAETLDLGETVLRNLLAASDLSEREARSLLGGFLFRGDDVYKRANVLSGGELSRLGLACALAKQAGLLLLDEPTNHLDMGSAETLASAIEETEGTVVFVSHDRTFIDEVCTHVFAMLPDGRSMLFEGKLPDYERLAATAGFPDVLAPEPEASAAKASAPASKSAAGAREASHDEIKELKRRKQRLTSRVEQLDKEMDALRGKASQLETKLADPALATDFGKMQTLHKELETAQSRMGEAENEWLAASEELQTVTDELTSLGRA